MAAYPDKVGLNTAIVDNTKLDLSHCHITTANFMQIQPIMTKEMVPGETLKVDVETFSRMNPLPVPTFGRANIYNRGFFVPYRTIFRGWTDFITDSVHIPSTNQTKDTGIEGIVPTVRNSSLVQMFYDPYFYVGNNSYYGVERATGGSDADIVVNVDSAHTGTLATSAGTYYFKFTFVGRQILKILESLGYKINWNTEDETQFSALPLLAWTKIYLDWYYPESYHDTLIYNALYNLCNADLGTPFVLNVTDIARICQFIYTCYDSDYFVSAFDLPNSPNANNYSTDFRLVNIDTMSKFLGLGTSYNSVATLIDRGYVGNDSRETSFGTGSTAGSNRIGGADAPFIAPSVPAFTTGTPFGSGSGTQMVPTPISEYLLHGLHAMTDYMKRHQLAGSAAFQRYLARFGKALPVDKLNRSTFLGTQTIPLQIGDVMSTAPGSDPTNNQLGEYAGKGIAYGENGKFEFSTDEYGLFIIVSSINPVTGYYQGIDRNVMHLRKLDFWTPEFDCLGNQPITADELYMSYNGTGVLSGTAIHNQVFGFAPRYAEYKMKLDKVTGNFRIPSLNGDAGASGSTFNGSSSWHLMRKFTDSSFGAVSGMVHSVNFVQSIGDPAQFNRIFDNQSITAPDQFTIIHNFNAVSFSPMKSLYDTYEFEQEGKKVDLQIGGVKKN